MAGTVASVRLTGTMTVAREAIKFRVNWASPLHTFYGGVRWVIAPTLASCSITPPLSITLKHLIATVGIRERASHHLTTRAEVHTPTFTVSSGRFATPMTCTLFIVQGRYRAALATAIVSEPSIIAFTHTLQIITCPMVVTFEPNLILVIIGYWATLHRTVGAEVLGD